MIDWQASINALSNDPNVSAWLTQSGSLTAKFKQIAHHDFHLQVIDEQGDEVHGWQRQSLLFVQQQACLFAIIDVNAEVFKQHRTALTTLGQGAIGEKLLPAESLLKRQFRYGRIKNNHALLAPIAQLLLPNTHYFLRQSAVAIAPQQAITLTEVFLPALYRHPCHAI